jgi:hypothetical protein
MMGGQKDKKKRRKTTEERNEECEIQQRKCASGLLFAYFFCVKMCVIQREGRWRESFF